MATLSFQRSAGRSKGRSVDPAATSRLGELLAGLPRRRDLLIEALHRVQDADRQLSAAMITALADEFGLAPAEVFEVATFYHHFDVVKEGEPAPAGLTVRVCESLSCELAGARGLIERLQRVLGESVRVQPVPCVGRCAQAPAVVVDQFPVAPADVDSIRAAIAQGQRSCPLPGGQDYAAYRQGGGYGLLDSLLAGARPPETLFVELEQAGLRGLGGAGFPAGRKWRLVSQQPAPRLLVVNADEGEPGTFKDRHYLERDPHRFIEGMLIAAWATQCEGCYIYLRDEYAGVRGLLERELAALRADPGWPAGALPAIHLRRGAGAYICGEESALIESVEGKRGMPRLRPPYVAEVGLFGRPTLAHNVETLYWVPEILQRGAAWFSSFGRRGRKGLRSFSVSGRVCDPGVKLAPAGISVRELIDEYCGGMPAGRSLYAYVPGGASGGILPASLADLPLDFDTLQPHGCLIGSAAVIVLSDQDSARDAALNFMNFFRHESCGQCTPCRVGTAKAATLMQRTHWDRELLEQLSQAMIDASICGLGQAAPNPLQCVLRYFPQELARLSQLAGDGNTNLLI